MKIEGVTAIMKALSNEGKHNANLYEFSEFEHDSRFKHIGYGRAVVVLGTHIQIPLYGEVLR